MTFAEKERGGMRGKGEDLLAWWKGFAGILMISDVYRALPVRSESYS